MDEQEYLSIKDFSRLSGIKETTLRYWDQLSLFLPAKRSASGYRYYSPYQLITVNAIKVAEDMGLSIKELLKISSDRTPEIVLDVLNEKSEELQQKLIELRRTCDVIKTFRRMMGLGIHMTGQDVSVRFHEDVAIEFGPRNDWSKVKPDAPLTPLLDFYEDFLKSNTDLRFPIGGYWENWQSFKRDINRPDYFFTIDPNGDSLRKSGIYLTHYAHGFYGSGVDIDGKMEEFLDKENRQPLGPVYSVYLLDAVSVRNPDDFLRQTSVAI